MTPQRIGAPQTEEPSFETFRLHPDIAKGVRSMGFTKPTAVQSDAIPPALQGKDILACAATGSGKTAAFLLPILHDVISKQRGTTRALVIVPTRELAAQILDDFRTIAKFTPVKAAAIFGGVGMGDQEKAFRSGADVLIATPGRLLDHFQYSYAKLPGLEWLVLDEADRMLDMGFLPDIRRVLRHIPGRRQTLFFSATIPTPIADLTRQLLTQPVKINVERPAAPAARIRQAVYPVAQDMKSALLLALLEGNVMREVLVFARTKHRTNRLADYLAKGGIKTARIHGNRSQRQRTDALKGFKEGQYRVLVATDIAARGIDVEALGHVLNFDVPTTPEDYIHRIGRTGRADLSGDAFTFVSPEEESGLRAIERAIAKKLPRETLASFNYNTRSHVRPEIPLSERFASARGGGRRAPGRGSGGRSDQRNGRGQAGGSGGGRGDRKKSGSHTQRSSPQR